MAVIESEMFQNFFRNVQELWEKQVANKDAIRWELMKPLVDNLIELSNKDVPEKLNLTELIRTILNYIEISLQFINQIENLRIQTKYAVKCFEAIKGLFSTKKLANSLIEFGSAVIFDEFLYGKYSFVCKRALIDTYNTIATESDKNLRMTLAKSMITYLYHLIDAINTYGDYGIQMEIMETLFRIFGNEIKQRKVQYDFIPDSKELSDSLVYEVDVSNFESSVRKWLNKYNKKSNTNIFSIACKEIMFGTMPIFPPGDMNVLWIDFNLAEKIVNWYCRLEGHEWIYVSLPGNQVKKIEVLRPLGSESVTLEVHYSDSCLINNLEVRSLFESASKVLKLIFDNSEKEMINKMITNVLPTVFKNEFLHTSERISRFKLVYKPLKNRVSQSRRSFSSEASSVSRNSRIQAENLPHSRLNKLPSRDPSTVALSDINYHSKGTSKSTSSSLNEVAIIENTSQLQMISESPQSLSETEAKFHTSELFSSSPIRTARFTGPPSVGSIENIHKYSSQLLTDDSSNQSESEDNFETARDYCESGLTKEITKANSLVVQIERMSVSRESNKIENVGKIQIQSNILIKPRQATESNSGIEDVRESVDEKMCKIPIIPITRLKENADLSQEVLKDDTKNISEDKNAIFDEDKENQVATQKSTSTTDKFVKISAFQPNTVDHETTSAKPKKLRSKPAQTIIPYLTRRVAKSLDELHLRTSELNGDFQKGEPTKESKESSDKDTTYNVDNLNSTPNFDQKNKFTESLFVTESPLHEPSSENLISLEEDFFKKSQNVPEKKGIEKISENIQEIHGSANKDTTGALLDNLNVIFQQETAPCLANDDDEYPLATPDLYDILVNENDQPLHKKVADMETIDQKHIGVKEDRISTQLSDHNTPKDEVPLNCDRLPEVPVSNESQSQPTHRRTTSEEPNDGGREAISVNNETIEISQEQTSKSEGVKNNSGVEVKENIEVVKTVEVIIHKVNEDVEKAAESTDKNFVAKVEDMMTHQPKNRKRKSPLNINSENNIKTIGQEFDDLSRRHSSNENCERKELPVESPVLFAKRRVLVNKNSEREELPLEQASKQQPLDENYQAPELSHMSPVKSMDRTNVPKVSKVKSKRKQKSKIKKAKKGVKSEVESLNIEKQASALETVEVMIHNSNQDTPKKGNSVTEAKNQSEGGTNKADSLDTEKQAAALETVEVMVHNSNLKKENSVTKAWNDKVKESELLKLQQEKIDNKSMNEIINVNTTNGDTAKAQIHNLNQESQKKERIVEVETKPEALNDSWENELTNIRDLIKEQQYRQQNKRKRRNSLENSLFNVDKSTKTLNQEFEDLKYPIKHKKKSRELYRADDPKYITILEQSLLNEPDSFRKSASTAHKTPKKYQSRAKGLFTKRNKRHLGFSSTSILSRIDDIVQSGQFDLMARARSSSSESSSGGSINFSKIPCFEHRSPVLDDWPDLEIERPVPKPLPITKKHINILQNVVLQPAKQHAETLLEDSLEKKMIDTSYIPETHTISASGQMPESELKQYLNLSQNQADKPPQHTDVAEEVNDQLTSPISFENMLASIALQLKLFLALPLKQDERQRFREMLNMCQK